ncbi:MAG TPA: hypothetical protein VLT91_04085 [Rhizomicrobium sp.]|nr:hypothetical protein [Rhizomicrobium sp.]
MLRQYAYLLALFCLAGCAQLAPPPPYEMQTPFNRADFTAWMGAGPGDIKGQAFMKTVGGDVKTCAGNPVYLLPDNAFDRELVTAIRLGRKPDVGRIFNGEAAGSGRKSICDASGNFSFESLPVGSWIVIAQVQWGVPNQYFVEQQGGALLETVSVSKGTTKVYLTDADFIGR